VDAAADAIARFDHQHLAPGGFEISSGGKAGRSGADDDRVHLEAHARAAGCGEPRARPIVCWHPALQMKEAVLFALLLACTPRTAPPHRRIALTPCRLKGSGYPAQCGTLRVPEDRARPSGRQIDLKISVVPALAREPAPDPLFLLAGGPGQAATEAMGPLLGAFERLHRTRDLVLVDQRGTGSSRPLRCDLNDPSAPLVERLAPDALREDKFRKCLAAYDADPRFYTTSIAMQDLDDVRAGLGADQIDLWGGSYGTRAALIYLREHGEHARATVLDGVAPLSLKLPVSFARDAQRSMDLLFKH
jgi:pimeloyl-ACP methyl ester carboxylesterase